MWLWYDVTKCGEECVGVKVEELKLISVTEGRGSLCDVIPIPDGKQDRQRQMQDSRIAASSWMMGLMWGEPNRRTIDRQVTKAGLDVETQARRPRSMHDSCPSEGRTRVQRWVGGEGG
jgi:hypothetical protein